MTDIISLSVAEYRTTLTFRVPVDETRRTHDAIFEALPVQYGPALSGSAKDDHVTVYLTVRATAPFEALSLTTRVVEEAVLAVLGTRTTFVAVTACPEDGSDPCPEA